MNIHLHKELPKKFKLYDKIERDNEHRTDVQKLIINIISSHSHIQIKDLIRPLYNHVLNKYLELDEYTLQVRGPYTSFIKWRITELLNSDEIELLDHKLKPVEWNKHAGYEQPSFNLIRETTGYIRIPRKFDGRIIIII
jgi:hypothetical protein